MAKEKFHSKNMSSSHMLHFLFFRLYFYSMFSKSWSTSLLTTERWLNNARVKLLDDNKVHNKISLLFNKSSLLLVIFPVHPQLERKRVVS